MSVVVNTGTEEHNGWRDPIGGSRIKTLKMLGAEGGLFLLSFLPLLLPCWVEKKVSLFSKEVKC